MVKYLKLVAILACVVISAASFALAFRTPRSPFLVQSPVIDLGEVRQGETVSTTIPLVNNTGGSITLARIVPSCGCTTTGNLAGKQLRSGESTELPVTWESEDDVGSSFTDILIEYTNDETQGELLQRQIVQIKANVLATSYVASAHVE